MSGCLFVDNFSDSLPTIFYSESVDKVVDKFRSETRVNPSEKVKVNINLSTTMNNCRPMCRQVTQWLQKTEDQLYVVDNFVDQNTTILVQTEYPWELVDNIVNKHGVWNLKKNK